MSLRRSSCPQCAWAPGGSAYAPGHRPGGKDPATRPGRRPGPAGPAAPGPLRPRRCAPARARRRYQWG
ncbi:hypothetical protein DDQ41_11190 [Streptomyces spongiicola]|uniref:Uncharacterized protein n=1 Tax=Streptomyces spongiicola TaxID=1690221 RepID=A0ABN5KM27_9ACTN|nr:hypothetical protein DDQ41_11190 [Streptomyces spongiicola]